MVFTCKFGCGAQLYRGDGGGYYEMNKTYEDVTTNIKHECPELNKSVPDRDPSNHSPSKYITDRETRDMDIEAKLNNIDERLEQILNYLIAMTRVSSN